MRRAILVLPVLGIVAAVAVPLARHVQMQRHENRALEVLHEVRAAQERFRGVAGGYATDIASLVDGCASGTAALDAEPLRQLERAGYAAQVRAARGVAAIESRACRGHLVAADYYVAVSPVSATELGLQAFAAQAQTGVYLFYDGIAPDEAGLERGGLATPLEQRTTFKIP